MNKIQIKFAKLHKEAVIPKAAKPGDAGVDLTAVSVEYNYVYNTYDINFGLSVEIPEGYVGLIFPRSSVYKYNHLLTNSVGVIDSGYRGSLGAKFVDRTKDGAVKGSYFQPGERVAQLVIVPYVQQDVLEVEHETLTKTERGEGGFGHSGK